ncbi:MAG: hypothetical protein R3D63_02155 [Paracoccaceae bacterium]
MLLRVVLILGIGLVLAGFGAAGWQYWQSSSEVETASAEVGAGAPEVAGEAQAAPQVVAAAPAAATGAGNGAGQDWMISEGGGLVPRGEVRNFLVQDRFVEERRLRFRLRVPLTALVSAGEQLPAEVYREAFAEVRAGVVGADLCAPLLAAWAAGCALQAASLDEGSYDPATGTAAFDVTLVYAMQPEAQALPDLATRSLVMEYLRLTPEAGSAGTETPQAFLAAAVEAAGAACAGRDACRVMGLALSWDSPADLGGMVQLGALQPLPKGVFPAPPLF